MTCGRLPSGKGGTAPGKSEVLSGVFFQPKKTGTLLETNELPMKIPIFPCKYHQKLWIFHGYVSFREGTPCKNEQLEPKVMEVDGSDDLPFQLGELLGSSREKFQGVHQVRGESTSTNLW